MVDRIEQLNDATSRFLLGQLSAAEQVVFEERLLVDDSLAALVRLAECELADDYAFERLSVTDRELFEQRFLITAGRQKHLEVSIALRDRFGSVSLMPAQVNQSVIEKLQQLFTLDRPVRKLAFGLAILILLVGTVWLISREPHINRRFIARRPPATPTPAKTSEVNHPSNNTARPNHGEIPVPLPVHEPQIVVDLVSAEGHVAQVSLPGGERDIVRLRLPLKGDHSGTYRVNLLNVAGRSVSGAKALKPLDGRIEFDIPARLLRTGDYQVEVSRVDKLLDMVTLFHFRVVDKPPLLSPSR